MRDRANLCHQRADAVATWTQVGVGSSTSRQRLIIAAFRTTFTVVRQLAVPQVPFVKKAPRSDLVIVLVLGLIAVFFRFYRLDELPIGLWRDEAANGLEALRVLDGQFALFYGTREPLFIYLVAASIALLGRNPLAIRFAAAAAGAVTVPLTYLLVKKMLERDRRDARLVAALASCWLATSYWHVNFSRLGFRGVLLPLFAALTFYLFWSGWNQIGARSSTRRVYAWFSLAGASLGAALYTYTPARLLPLLLIPFFWPVVRDGWSAIRGRTQWRILRSTHAPTARALAVFTCCAVLVSIPLGLHFLAEPKSLLPRSGVSIFRADTGEPLPLVLARNVARQLGMFGFLADPNTRHNPAGRPAFDLVTLALFATGSLFSLRRLRKVSYQFCVCGFLAMQLPALLTYPELPHSLRAIGALPVVYVFPALGLEASWSWVRARTASVKVRGSLAVGLGLCLLLSAGISFRDYFDPKVDEIELVKAFDPRFVEIASVMNQLDEPEAVWLIPVGPSNEQRMAYFVIDFLYQGQAPHRYVHVDQETLARELTQACAGARRALLLQRTGDWPAQPWYDLYADWGGLVEFTLDREADRLKALPFNGFEVLPYELPENAVFSLPSHFRPLELQVSDDLKLTGVAYGLRSPSSAPAWAALQWRADDAPDADYVSQLVIRGGEGLLAATMDKVIFGAQTQLTSQWEPGQQETTYYTLDRLAQVPCAGYSVEISVYPLEAGGEAASPARGEPNRRTFVIANVPSSCDRLESPSSASPEAAR
jgi:hypothetical protein